MTTSDKIERIKSLYQELKNEVQSLDHEETKNSEIILILTFGFENDKIETIIKGHPYSVLNYLKQDYNYMIDKIPKID